MRIIGGNQKGKRILVARKGTRPTKGIVREAVLQVIQSRIPGAHVLDMFAGSGALGLEALSRGAQSCVFIEQHPAVLYKNIENIVPELNTKVIRNDYVTALKRLANNRFSVIFMDPPYRKTYVERAVFLIQQYDVLEDSGIMVIEHHPDEQFALPDGYVIIKKKRYGDTMISYVTIRGENE
jgi:16S rRNA (guanine(966)-N(2))-methyltransferase RsmD